MSQQLEKRKEWSSSLAFIMACVGSAVGLGNIWKFPYITFENGGGIFVLIYLIAVVLVGFPIMLAEMLAGRHGHLNVYGTMKKISKDSWFGKGLGLLFLFSAFVILSYYSVVAGWTVDYFINSIAGNLSPLNAGTVGPRFVEFVTSGGKQVFYHTVFILTTGLIVLKGTSSIEKALKFMMPSLTILVIAMASISLYNYGGGKTFAFLFHFDMAKLTPHAALEAIGHAFFTLSLAMGAMVVYGSYLPKNVNIVKTGFWIAFLDTLIALTACVMIFPIIFGTDMEIKESSAILFTSLMVQFNQLPAGNIIAGLFYLLVAFAALSSTISLLEPIVSFLSESFNIKRKHSTIISAFLVWFVGLFSALGNGAVEFISQFSPMDHLDYFTSNWTLPVGGVLMAIFVGHFLPKEEKISEFETKYHKIFYPCWNIALGYIAPFLIFLVILYKIGLF